MHRLVQNGVPVEPGERRAERRQERRVGIPAGEIAHAGRETARAAEAERRLRRDDRPPAAVRDHEAAPAESAVRGRDRCRADSDSGCQLADRRQLRTRLETAVPDCPLDLRRDLRRSSSCFYYSS